MPDFGDQTPGDGSRHDWFGTVDPYAPSVANGGITPEQWAEYQKKRRRAAILGILGTVGGMAGAGLLGSALGGGGAAAGSASVPGAVGASSAPLGTGSVVASGALPSGVGAAASGAGVGAAAAGGGAAAKGFLGGLSARDLASLGLTGASLIGSAVQNKPDDLTPNTQTTDPNLLKLIQTMQGRLDKSEPLYGSILDMANGLLPTQYQKGGGGMP